MKNNRQENDCNSMVNSRKAHILGYKYRKIVKNINKNKIFGNIKQIDWIKYVYNYG